MNHLHHLTANIYRRTRIFDTDRFKLKPLLSAANGFTETRGNVLGSKQASSADLLSKVCGFSGGSGKEGRGPTSQVRATFAGTQLTATTNLVVPYVEWGLKNPCTFILRVSDKVDIDIHAGHVSGA